MLEDMLDAPREVAEKFLAALQNFRPEDREIFFRVLWEKYCRYCGDIRQGRPCTCTRDE